MPNQKTAVLLGALCPLLWVVGCTETIEQPIRFNHKLHVTENGLECGDCHQYFETHSFSGLPGKEVCLECHEEPQTDSKEEEKIREYAARDEEIPWKRLHLMPDHVNYSHRRHVKVAGLACETCHGAIAEATSPPTRPLVEQDMDWCLDCHEDKGATQDCIHCHK